MSFRIICADVMDGLRQLEDESVHCVVTSPPYWGLRDYGVVGQIGLEPTPDAFVARMVEVFREVKRVLRHDGVCFVNFGDSYSSATHVKLREDLTAEDEDGLLQILRKTLGPQGREGHVLQLLQKALEEYEPRALLRTEPSILSSQQDGFPGEAEGSEAPSATKNDGGLGGQVRLLRRDRIDVSLSGSHKGGRSEGIQQEGRPARCLAQGDPRRTAARQVPDSVLELQRSARTLRHVSALDFDLSEIPDKARRYFRTILKPKDLMGMPWRVAFALQADGWWLRSDIIWSKPNPMPESVTDRPTKAHEYVFLLTKAATYYYDAEVIKEEGIATENRGGAGKLQEMVAAAGAKNDGFGKRWRPRAAGIQHKQNAVGNKQGGYLGSNDPYPTRNKRSVWTIATAPFPEAHFATFPPELPEICIKAGCPVGGTVLDPFAGAGTTLLVADRLQRNAIGIELNPEYAAMADRRLRNDRGSLLDFIEQPKPAKQLSLLDESAAS